MRGAEIVTGASGRHVAPGRLALAIGGPVAITAVSWIYLAMMIGDSSTIPGMTSMMMSPQLFDPMQLFGLFLMWSIMMAAMMLPTVAPMILAYARMQAADRHKGAGRLPVLLFSGGYVLAWTVFSLVAAVAQAWLTNLAFMSPMMMKTVSGPLGGAILVVAGLYQFTPLKRSCLRQCRTPISFLMTQWRDGNLGAVIMGWRHGLFCMGCCWALMALLFIVGVMNSVWIIAISLYVLAEKALSGGEQLAKLAGAGMVGLGFYWIII